MVCDFGTVCAALILTFTTTLARRFREWKHVVFGWGFWYAIFSPSFSLSLQSLLKKSNYVNVMLNKQFEYVLRFAHKDHRHLMYSIYCYLLVLVCLHQLDIDAIIAHQIRQSVNIVSACRFFCSCLSINPKSTERMQKDLGNYQRHKRWFNGILLSNRQLKGITMP